MVKRRAKVRNVAAGPTRRRRGGKWTHLSIMQTLEGNVKVLKETKKSLLSTIGTLCGEFLSLVLEGLKPGRCQCSDVRRYLDS